MAKTTFDEEVYLRVLTGNLVGKALADVGANKVAVVIPRNNICIAMGSATAAGYISRTNAVVRTFVVEKPEDVDAVVDFAPQIIVFQFGGETPAEETKNLFREVIKRLNGKDVSADVVVHVRTWAMGAFKETESEPFWKGRNIYVYTVDFDNGKVFLNRYENGSLKKVLEYHVTLEHADLLNRSLKDRSVTFA